MVSLELPQPATEEMQHQEKVGDDKTGVNRQLNHERSQCPDRFLFHGKVSRYFAPAVSRGCVSLVPGANCIALPRFSFNVPLHLKGRRWLTLQINILRTSRE